MMKKQLEQRIRELERGLHLFDGIDWIIKVGEMAEIKTAVLDTESARIDSICGPHVTGDRLSDLDREIRLAIAPCTRRGEQNRAFVRAYEMLKEWLDPVLPERRAGCR